jgi:hypothetical protein
MQKRFLDRREAAEFLTAHGFRTSWRTLQKMATVGGGPLYRVFGGRAVYAADDLNAWAEAKLSPPRRSTSDVAGPCRGTEAA